VAEPIAGEEVGGGLRLFVEEAAHVHVGDARRAGRMARQGAVGFVDEDRDLPRAAHLDELRKRDRQPGPPRLHRRRRSRRHDRQPRRERLERRLHALAGRSAGVVEFKELTDAGGRRGVAHDRRRPGEAGRIIDTPRERRGDHVDQVVDDEVAKCRRQQVGTEDRLGGEGDLGTVPLPRAFAGRDRHGNAHQRQRVAGGVGRVVPLVDPPQRVEVVEVAGELVEVHRRLERERSVVEAKPRRCLGERQRLGAGDDDRVAAAGRLVRRRQEALDRIDDARRSCGRRDRRLAARAASARSRLQCQRHAQKRLVTAAQGGAGAFGKLVELPHELGFVFGAVPHEPRLPPHVGLLRHDPAAGALVVVEPFQLRAEAVEGIVAGGRRRLAVGRLEGGGEPVEEPRQFAGRSRQASHRHDESDAGGQSAIGRRAEAAGGPVEDARRCAGHAVARREGYDGGVYRFGRPFVCDASMRIVRIPRPCLG
jgi:hypothetical protein